MARASRHRRWFGTVDLEDGRRYDPHIMADKIGEITWFYWGKHRGDQSGRTHGHFIVHYSTPRSLQSAKLCIACEWCHMEVARGNVEDGIKYIRAKIIDDSECEFGVRPHQGKRSDIEEFVRDVAELKADEYVHSYTFDMLLESYGVDTLDVMYDIQDQLTEFKEESDASEQNCEINSQMSWSSLESLDLAKPKKYSPIPVITTTPIPCTLSRSVTETQCGLMDISTSPISSSMISMEESSIPTCSSSSTDTLCKSKCITDGPTPIGRPSTLPPIIRRKRGTRMSLTKEP